MLYLNFAPSLDILVSQLSTEVRTIWTDPFASPEIIVSSPALGKWLTLRLAENNAGTGTAHPPGCIANLQLPTLEKFLWKLLQPGDAVMLDQLHLQQVVCALLDAACISRPGFEQVRAYLSGPSGIDPLKRVQLAGRIAHQFMEYEYNRPGVWRENEGIWRPLGIDGTWMRGKLYPFATDDELWQSELYRMVRGCFAEHSEDGWQYYTLPQLYRLRREQGRDDGLPWHVAPGTWFLFGVTRISHFHRNVLVEISQMHGCDLHVFLTNPCAEYWEDVKTVRGTPRRSWKNTTQPAPIAPRIPEEYRKEELEQPFTDQKLLELWGNAGKENVFLWCQDAQWNFNYTAPEWADLDSYTPSSVLEALQYSLLRRQNGLSTPSQGMTADSSFQILGCPDPGREIEEVREQILDAVNDGTVSMLNEIVVYLPDPSMFIPFIHRVFGRFSPSDPDYIPYCILGVSGTHTHFAQGMTALFRLLQGRFDRAHVFDLLRNPLVQCTRSIPPGSLPVWEQWAEELSIFRGYNRLHRQRMGDDGQACTDAHTFEFGMARMVLGELIDGPVEIDFYDTAEDDAAAALPVIPYRDFNTSDRNSLELFCATVESLWQDCDAISLHADARTPEETVDTIGELVTEWFGKIPDIPGVDGTAEGLMRKTFIDGLATITLQSSIGGRDRITFEEFITLAAGCLADEVPAHATAWTGGITFAPLTPAMVLPHTTIIVAGLDDSAFPGSNQHPSWDLLAKKRIVGDFDPVRANRFAFLELLHAARKRLVLMYRSRNMQKEEELNPSSVLLELAGFLSDCGLRRNEPGTEERGAVSRTIPWIVHEALLHDASKEKRCRTWSTDEIALARIAAKGVRVDNRYALDTSGTVVADQAAMVTLSDYEVRGYFKNPLEYHLAGRLGIREQDSADTLLATDEPFAAGTLAMMALYSSVWTVVLRKLFPENPADTVTDISTLQKIARDEMGRHYTLLTATGGTPEAMIGRIERRQLLEWAGVCVAPLLKLASIYPHYRLIEKTDLSLGREGAAGMLEVTLKSGARCRVRCSHSPVLVSREVSASYPPVLLSMKAEGKADVNPDLCIEGVLHLLYAHAATEDQSPPVLVQLNWKKPGLSHVALKNSDDVYAQCHSWVMMLLEEMVRKEHDHFPFRVIQVLTKNTRGSKKSWDQRLALVSRQSIRDVLEDRYAFRSYNYGFTLAEPRIPDMDDEGLRARADARFGPMLSGEIFQEEDAV